MAVNLAQFESVLARPGGVDEPQGRKCCHAMLHVQAFNYGNDEIFLN